MSNHNCQIPTLQAGRKPFHFDQGTYQLVVVKADYFPLPGPCRTSRAWKIVFEVFHSDSRKTLTRYKSPRIAMFLVLDYRDGLWEAGCESSRHFLQILGIEPDAIPDYDLTAIFWNRWIEGDIGEAGPDGFNPLIGFRSTEGVWSRTADIPAPSGRGTVIIRAREEATPAEYQEAAAHSCYPRTFDPGDRSSGPRHSAPNQGAIAGTLGVRNNPARSQALPARAAKAYSQYKEADQQLSSTIGRSKAATDSEAYEWLSEHCYDKRELGSFATWSRYVRLGRSARDDNKNLKRSGRSGRSIANAKDI